MNQIEMINFKNLIYFLEKKLIFLYYLIILFETLKDKKFWFIYKYFNYIS